MTPSRTDRDDSGRGARLAAVMAAIAAGAAVLGALVGVALDVGGAGPATGGAGPDGALIVEELRAVRQAVEGMRAELQALATLPSAPAGAPRRAGDDPDAGARPLEVPPAASAAPSAEALTALGDRLDALVAALDRTNLAGDGVSQTVPRQTTALRELVGDFRTGDDQSWFQDDWFGRSLRDVYLALGRPDISRVREDGSLYWSYSREGEMAWPTFTFLDGVAVKVWLHAR